MLANMPTLGVRFSIDKVEETGSVAPGFECWKVLWRAVDIHALAGALLFAGDTAATLNGREYVYCIAIQSTDESVLNAALSALEESEEFNRLAASPPFVAGAEATGEPLVDAGKVDLDGNLVGGESFWARPALDEVRSEDREKVTVVGTAKPMPEREHPASSRTANLPPLSSVEELLQFLLENFSPAPDHKHNYWFWLTPEELCDIVEHYSNLVQVQWLEHSSALSEDMLWVHLLNKKDIGGETIHLVGLFPFASEADAHAFCLDRTASPEHLFGQLKELWGIEGKFALNFQGESGVERIHKEDYERTERNIAAEELWAYIRRRRSHLGLSPPIEEPEEAEEATEEEKKGREVGSRIHEQVMRQEAKRLSAEHGELVEVRCVSGPPDSRIELVFADAHEEVITRPSGATDITMMEFGHAGTGTDCFWAFLNEAGFKDISLEQLETMKGPQVLRKGEQPEEMMAEKEPKAPEPEEAMVEEEPAVEELVEPLEEEAEPPLWADVSRDPSLVNPLILEQLEKSMCFMVRDETGPVAALIIRASHDDFRGLVTPETPMSLYIQHYRAPTFDLYGVYPFVWDDPEQPFFKETWMVGAGSVTGPPDPLSEGQLSRLEALLSQQYTYFLAVDQSDRLVAAWKVHYSLETQEHFLYLMARVRAARAVTISNAELISALGEYMDSVSLEEVKAVARRLHAAEMEPEEEEWRPLLPMEAEGERVYPWQGRSRLNRVGLALGAMVLFFLCLGSAGYIMSGIDLDPIFYRLMLLFVFAIPAIWVFEALRPTTMRELVVSPERGLIFRRKSGKEKPVMAQIDRVVEAWWRKALLIDGRTPEDKHVRAQIAKGNLEEGEFEKFKEDLQRVIQGVSIEVPTRRPVVGRLLAGLASSIPGAVALVAFLFGAGVTMHHYLKGVEHETILVIQVVIVLVLFAVFVLFARLSTSQSDRRNRMIASWSVLLVLGLIGTWVMVNYLLGVEPVRGELPSLPAVETPFPGASPTAIPTPGSPGADRIIAYNPGLAQREEWVDPQGVLGARDLVEEPCCSGMLQLGAGGSILLGFTDNAIYDGPGPDFQIFGESARDDFIIVEVSADGQAWYAYPKTDESPEPFDLTDVGLEQVVFLRITDVQPGTANGAELDAIEAIHNGAPLERALSTDLPDAIARADATLREGPGSGYDAVGQVTKDTILTVQDSNQDGTWTRVQTPEGITGWCDTTQIALNVSLSDY